MDADTITGNEYREMKAKLESSLSHVRAGEYEQAQEAIEGLATLSDCDLCDRIETSLVGGITFVALSPPDPQRRETLRGVLVDEIEWYINVTEEAMRDG